MDKNLSKMDEFRQAGSEPPASFLNGGNFALGAMVGFVFFLFLYVFEPKLLLIAAKSFFWDVVADLPTLLIALVALLLSWKALTEQKMMRQAATDPVVLAHIGQNRDQPMIVEIQFSNVGAGAAVNLTVCVEKPANVENFSFFGREKPFEFGVLKGDVPIKVLLQGQTKTFSIGTGPDLIGKGEFLAPFTVRLSYQDITGKSYLSEHIIDMKEMANLAAEDPPQVKIWRALVDIEKNTRNLK